VEQVVRNTLQEDGPIVCEAQLQLLRGKGTGGGGRGGQMAWSCAAAVGPPVPLGSPSSELRASLPSFQA
jgi:hypothetical protein